ncbi:MAG: molybdopterin oxidoreductase family protein [Candidatus Kaistia colombiensis]|nr:MAG: molybdopterin oxidoreductase family protein [Kaistia sp.]
MNAPVFPRIGHSACPHDCPSTCALDVELLEGNRIGRIRGAKDNDYTQGVICAKVARYAERVNNPDRLKQPLRRKGEKGSGEWLVIDWEDALDEVAEAFLKAEAKLGAETVWPYYYAGTMGLVQRDGINRLRHAKRYSGFYGTICTNMAWTGYIAGAGKIAGSDPREMAKSDCVVIWGTNAVATQVNVMTHAIKARKERGAKIVAIDIYQNETMKQADMALCLKPGTDGALACAVMHVLFRDGFADRAYLARYTDEPQALEAHLADKTPEWGAAITGLSVDEIVAFATLIGTTQKTFFRLGYGFSRQRNGAVAMHAALSIPAVTGAWQYEGGGAFHSNSGIFHLDKTAIEGLDLLDPSVRQLDQSRTASVLTNDPDALAGGPPVTAMIIQNTNPVTVCPDQTLVKQGFARPDLFVAVHEQIMTDTAKMADIVLPATMFLEHDDIYKGGGHQYIILGPKLVEPPDSCRTNHQVIAGLAKRLGLEQPGFAMTEREHIDLMLQRSGWGTLVDLEEKRWIDCQSDFDTAHFLNGFGHDDGKYHFRVDWTSVDSENYGAVGPHAEMPTLPDHWGSIEAADEAHPFRLATSPARQFLNSSFNETPTSIAREVRPELMIHPEDAAGLGVAGGDLVRVGNRRGEVKLHIKLFEGLKRGVVISEGLWPNSAFVDGKGINTLTGADPVAPFGGAAVHDTKVWVKAT